MMAISQGKKRAQGVYSLGNQRWRIEVTRTNRLGKRVRRRRVVTATNLTEARAARAVFEVEVERELSCGPAPRDPRSVILSDFAEGWLAHKRERVRESTFEQYRRAVDDFLVPVMGHVSLRDLHRDLVVDFIGWLEKQRLRDGRSRSDASLKSIYRAAGGMLRDAAAEVGVLDPTHRVTGPSSNRKRTREQRTLTRDQLNRLVAAVWRSSPIWGPAVELMAWTGMRTGEIRALQWRDVDERLEVITVQRSMARETSYPTKTGAPRHVPLIERFKGLLGGHRLQLAAAGRPVMGEALVFPSPRTGAAISPTTINSVLRKAAREMELEVKVSAQVLRRTFNTMFRAVATPEMVRDLMGHCSQEMTDLYHHTPLERRRERMTELCEERSVG
jgi:integrase